MENAHGIGTAAHRRDHVIGLAADGFGHLDQAFVADHGLEVPHHARIGSGPATVPMM